MNYEDFAKSLPLPSRTRIMCPGDTWASNEVQKRLTYVLRSLGSVSGARRISCGRRRGELGQHHLLPQCTVLENALLPALAGGAVGAELSARAIDLLGQVNLADRADDHPTMLSGGERERVALARALINSPALLLADEPTGSLDRNTSESLIELLVELNLSEGTTLIVVTHSPELAGRMDRVMELRDGSLSELETTR